MRLTNNRPPNRFPSLFAYCLFFVLMFSRASLLAAEPDDDLLREEGKGNELGLMTIRVLSAEDDKPIVDAAVKIQGQVKQRIRKTMMTDKNGEVVIEFAPNTPITYFSIEVSKGRFVPFYARWDNRRAPVKLVALKTVKLEIGNDLSGVIVDEAGAPIKNAQVELRLRATEYVSAGTFVFTLADLFTNEQGAWQIDNAPGDLSSIFFTVKHDDYLRAGGKLGDFTGNRLTMKMGKQISGQVVDTQGKPIPAARVLWGHSNYSSNRRDAITNQQGEFLIKNGPDGASLLTVAAAGFSPQMINITVTKRTQPFRFELETGHTIRGRVVDQDNKPIAGAFAASEYWRGQQTLRFRVDTDENGRFRWDDAPGDVVQFSIGKRGLMSARNVPLIPQEEEHTITLNPVLVISGSVTDATDGESIDEVKVTRGTKFAGRNSIYWRERESITQKGGEYSARYSEPSSGHYLRFESKNHETFESREFLSNEGNVTYDVKLKRRDATDYANGTVRFPDGTPAKQVKIFLVYENNRLQIADGKVSENSNAKRFQTDEHGRFSIPKPKTKSAIVVAVDEGVSIMSTDVAESEIEIDLQSWGRIEGRFTSSTAESEGREIQFNRRPREEDQELFNFIWTSYQATTKSGGRFSIPFVIPGEGYLSRTISREYGDGTSSSYPGWHQAVHVKSGKTTLVKYGGDGRKVTGQINFDTALGTPHDWTFNEPIYLKGQQSATNSTSGWPQRYLAIIDEDGAFTFDDVPAGEYQLTTTINGSGRSGIWGGNGGGIGRLSKNITITSGQDPVDLGTIPAERFQVLEIGDLAPSFQLDDLHGDSISRQSLNGKIALLEFVQPGNRGVQGFSETARRVHNKFKNNEQVVVVTIACYHHADQIKTAAKDQNVDWKVGVVPGLWARVPKRFMIRKMPTSILLGPNSKVQLIDAKTEDFVSQIESLLTQTDLFEAAKANGPLPRFTLHSYLNQSPVLKESDPPAAIVFADTDPSYDAVGDDRVVVLSSNADSLAEIGAFHGSGGFAGGSQICVDAERERVYVCENLASQITAFDLQFRKLWVLRDISCDNIALDPREGNLWASGGDTPQAGETVVISPDGKELAAHPIRALGIAYNSNDDSFWLVGPRILKMNRQQEIAFEYNDFNGVATTVRIDEGARQICIAVPKEFSPQQPHRVLRLQEDGELVDSIDMKEHRPHRLAVHNGAIWVATYQGLLRMKPKGTEFEKLDHVAHSLSISSDGSVWIANAQAILKLDDQGKEQARFNFSSSPRNSNVISF